MNIQLVTTKEQLEDAFSVRDIVFIQEQNVPREIEIDEYEGIATHFVIYDQNQPIAAARYRPYQPQGTVKLERFAVLKEYRGQHVGEALLQVVETEAAKNGYTTFRLNAQKHAEGFYAKFGYTPIGEPFNEAGIEHITMIKKTEAK